VAESYSSGIGDGDNVPKPAEIGSLNNTLCLSEGHPLLFPHARDGGESSHDHQSADTVDGESFNAEIKTAQAEIPH
jgi:hypothetical protein